MSDAFGRFTVNRWNCFDLVIVVGTDIGIATKLATGEDSVGSIGLVVRACRIGRVLRLMHSAPGMKELFDTLMHTLPGMMNVGGLLCLICFIYAAVGVQLFSRVAYHGALDPHCNFRTFSGALVALLRFATGENVNGFMHDINHVEDGCDEDPQYDDEVCGFSRDFSRIGLDSPNCRPLNGCGSALALPYFVSFMLFVPFVFLNLFIAVILEAFYETKDENGASRSSASSRWAFSGTRGSLPARRTAPRSTGGDGRAPWTGRGMARTRWMGRSTARARWIRRSTARSTGRSMVRWTVRDTARSTARGTAARWTAHGMARAAVDPDLLRTASTRR